MRNINRRAGGIVGFRIRVPAYERGWALRRSPRYASLNLCFTSYHSFFMGSADRTSTSVLHRIYTVFTPPSKSVSSLDKLSILPQDPGCMSYRPSAVRPWPGLRVQLAANCHPHVARVRLAHVHQSRPACALIIPFQEQRDARWLETR